LGNQTTARGESADSWLKSNLTSHKADMANIFEHIADAVSDQLTNNVVNLENQRISSLSGIEAPFKALHTCVSIHALHLVHAQYKLWKEKKGAKAGGAEVSECTGSLKASMGIPCWHMLADIFERGDDVQLSDFHPQWNLRYNPDNLVSGDLNHFVIKVSLLPRSDQMDHNHRRKKKNTTLIQIMM
jgi:hypothetical protein